MTNEERETCGHHEELNQSYGGIAMGRAPDRAGFTLALV